MSDEKAPLLIKRYASRRLYNTETSDYVTLEDISGFIRDGRDVVRLGVGDPGALAGGISKALITTAAGISVAIPSLFFYRYFRGKVDELVLDMEQEALKLVDAFHGTSATTIKK